MSAIYMTNSSNSSEKPIASVKATLKFRVSAAKMTPDKIPENGLFLIEGDRNMVAVKGAAGEARLLFRPQTPLRPDPRKEFHMLFLDGEECDTFRGEKSDKVNFNLGGFC